MADQWEEAAKNYKPDPHAAVPSSGDDDWKVWQDTGKPTEGSSAAPDSWSSLGNFITSPNGLLRGGARQLAHGISTVVSPNPGESRWSGGSDIIHGGEKMIAPVGIGALAPALVAAPGATAAGLAAGAGAGALGNIAARKGTELAGGGPEAQDFAGAAAEVPAAILGGKYIPKGVGNTFRADPRVAFNRSLRPIPSNPDFPERIPETISTIKAMNPGYRPEFEDGQINLIPAVQKALNAYGEQLEPYHHRMEGVPVDTKPIVEATREAVSRMLPSERNSPAAQRLIENAATDYSGMDSRGLQSRLEMLNKRLRSFYAGSPGSQSAAMSDIPEAVLKAQRDATADTLYRHLDPENAGAGPRTIQSKRSDLLDVLDAAQKRNNAIQAEQPLTPFGKFMDPIKGFIQSILPIKTPGAGLAFSEGSEGRSLPLLRRAFNAVGEGQGVNDFGAVPRPGPRLITAPADTSGPVPGAGGFAAAGSEFEPKIKLLSAPSVPLGRSGVTAPDIAGNARTAANHMNAGPRQIAAPETPLGTSGTTVPDIIGRSSRGQGGPQLLLPPPRPGVPPIKVLPSGPGAIGPAGSVPVLSEETPRAMPGELGGKMADVLRQWRERMQR